MTVSRGIDRLKPCRPALGIWTLHLPQVWRIECQPTKPRVPGGAVGRLSPAGGVCCAAQFALSWGAATKDVSPPWVNLALKEPTDL